MFSLLSVAPRIGPLMAPGNGRATSEDITYLPGDDTWKFHQVFWQNAIRCG